MQVFSVSFYSPSRLYLLNHFMYCEDTSFILFEMSSPCCNETVCSPFCLLTVDCWLMVTCSIYAIDVWAPLSACKWWGRSWFWMIVGYKGSWLKATLMSKQRGFPIFEVRLLLNTLNNLKNLFLIVFGFRVFSKAGHTFSLHYILRPPASNTYSWKGLHIFTCITQHLKGNKKHRINHKIEKSCQKINMYKFHK